MPEVGARIRKIDFSNFKAFAKYTMTVSDVNILVGPNNSGKSTIVGALRSLDAAIRFARTRAPSRIYIGDETLVGYRIPEDSLPISIENVLTNYEGAEARVTFELSNGNALALIFPEEGGCVLEPRLDMGVVTTAAAFKRAFPVSLVIVPVLGPVEHEERRRERATVVAGLSTHRASRHFRNYWHYNPEGFDTFANLVSRTWPGMTIKPPEFGAASGRLSMFCIEGRPRMTRELYWVGFGFQIWCQLLTHLSRATGNSLVVVDEPEVYLHPDVQRQLLGIIRDIGADVLLATHSSEIISEADPGEIVMIDKHLSRAERVRNVAGAQRALDSVGSSHNLTLTALARSRRILFVEGLDDFRLLRRFARRVGLQELSSGVGLTPLASGGFGSWERISVLGSGIGQALGAPLMVGAVYDRDYFCDEQIEEIVGNLRSSLSFAWILERKEIENYLLLPAALDRAVRRTLATRDQRSASKADGMVDCAALIDEITSPMKQAILAQLMARRHDYLGPKGRDKSHLYGEVLSTFDERWAALDTRTALISGKEVLRLLRERVQDLCGVTLTQARIVEAMTKDEVPAEIQRLLETLELFRTSQPPRGGRVDV